MKLCSYCGTENDIHATTCNACGGNEFKFKCDNCGTTFSEGHFCPTCGVKVGQQPKRCPQCGTEYFSNACPQCGYLPNSRTNSSETGYNYGNGSYNNGTSSGSGNPAKIKHLPLWILGWFFIFPLPLTIIISRKKDMHIGFKILIIAFAWLIYILFAS